MSSWRTWSPIAALISPEKVIAPDMAAEAPSISPVNIPSKVSLSISRKTMLGGETKRGYSPAGQVVGRIKDIPTAGEIIERTAREAEQVIRGLNGRLG